MGQGLLAGLRVVEAAHPLTEYAGLVLAGLGAEVYLVEPPDGSVTRRRLPRVPHAGDSPRGSMAFLTRNAGKRSVVIDPADPAQRTLLENLCTRADVVLSASGAPHHQIVAAAAARTRVTLTDPRNLGTSSIVGFAASGGMASSGWPHQPPCNSPSWLALDGAGVYAAAMALVGVLARRRGAGPMAYEIPYHEAAVAAITPWTRPLHSYGMEVAGQGIETRRLGPGGFPIYPASDGYVRVLVATPGQWDAFVALMGSPEDLVSGPWSDQQFRAENADALQPMCAEITRTRTVQELFLEGQRLGLTITPVYSLNGFRQDPHVRGRNILVNVSDPEFGDMELVRPPVVVADGTLDAPLLPAPGPGEHQAQAQAFAGEPPPPAVPAHDVNPARPLAGIRVLQLGVGAVVPEAASLLAQLGAEVIKLESLKRVDFLRQSGLNGLMDVNNCPTFNQLNLGTRSLAVDMSQTDGAHLVQTLASRCDIIMENMRGGVVENWGLDPDSARRLRDDVIYLSSQGLGRGVYDGFQTYGPNLQTFSGVTWMWGYPDDPFPVGTTLSHPDHLAGKQALVPLLAALLRRDTTGEGVFLEAAQVETAAYLIGDRYLEQFYADADLIAHGNRSTDMAPHGCYPCAGDDRWVAIAVEDDTQWERLCEAVGGDTGARWRASPELRHAPGRLDASATLDAELAQWTRHQRVDEVESLLQQAGVPVSRVVTGDDIATDTESHRSGFFATLAHPTAGTRVYTALPVHLVGRGRPPARRPPLLGEHTEHVLYDLLDTSGDLVDALMAGKTVGY